MRKILYILYQPYKWLIFLPFLIINTLVSSIFALFTASFISQKAGGYFGVIWARLNAFFTPVFVSVSGKENIKKNTSYIIVSNHQSHYDIFLIYGWLGIDFKWVMKMELRKIPGLGISCEKIGHIFIDRSNTQVAIESMNKVKQKLVNGTSVVIFPEGTRSTTGVMSPFKRGAFRLAFDIGLPILPITLIGTKDILPAKTINLFPGKVQMIIHEPIAITKYSVEEIDKLITDVSNVISAPLK
jgi:1-acyl-sn-glycerol-3-phosphate acyltransferase